jgi:hypothetical protein
MIVGGGCAARSGITNATLTVRIEDYLRLRQEAVREVGRIAVTEKPGELWTDVVELTEQIQARRQGSREGDILGGPVAVAIRSSLLERLSREDGPLLIAEVTDVQPEPFSAEINTRYPAAEPRSTMPLQILRVLPRLPKELSYRFVGRDLVLLDRNTGLILDVLRDAFPSATGVIS